MIILRTGIIYSIIICALISLSALYSSFLISIKHNKTKEDLSLSVFLNVFGAYWAFYTLANVLGWVGLTGAYKSISYVLNILLFLMSIPLFNYFIKAKTIVSVYAFFGALFFILTLKNTLSMTTISYWGVQTGYDSISRLVFVLFLLIPLGAVSINSIISKRKGSSSEFFVETITLVFVILEMVNIHSHSASWQLMLLRMPYILIGFIAYFYLSGEEATTKLAERFSPWLSKQILRLRAMRIPFFSKLLMLFVLLSVIPIAGAGTLMFLTFKEIIDLYIYKPLLWNLKTSKEEFIAALGNVQIQALFLIMLVIILVVIASSIASRAIAQSLKRIGNGMKKLEEGDFGYKLIPESNDEIGDLAKYFNVMAAEIKKSREIMENWNKALEKTVAERTKNLQMLYNLSKAMGSTLDLDELLSRSIGHITQIAGANCICIFLVEQGDIYRQRIAKGCPILQPFRAGEGIFGESVATSQIVKIADIKEASQSEKSALASANTKTLILVPMESKGKKIGLLFIGINTDYMPSDIELNLLSTIADQMSIAIENANVYEKEKEAVKRLMDIDKMKTELISMVSHELRTPITSIKGFLIHFISGTTGPVNDTQLKFLKIMSKEGDQLLSLVDNLLEFSRVEREGLKLKMEPVEMDKLIRSVIDSVQPQLNIKGVNLSLELNAGNASVNGDDMRLSQVLKNLIGNAIKFSKETPEIKITSKLLPDNKLEVRIVDNGIGISSEHLGRLFEKFYQIDGSLTRKVGGLGLGLAISKEIVEAHGGRIQAESQGLGKGSTFIFTIPVLK